MTTFDDYKSKVSIAQVAEAIGFTFNKAKGKTQPVYSRETAQGGKEEIVIKNPDDNLKQHYFDRNYKGGDVINFIKDHLREFGNITGYAKNDYVKINMVLSHFAQIPYQPKMETVAKAERHKELEKDRYVVSAPGDKNLTYLTKERMIDPATVERFLPFIRLIQDTQSKGNYINIAFPYTNSQSTEATNYEIRNHGYKGMASGGDKEKSAWIATNANSKAAVKSVIFFESAIDAMSFYEIKKNYYKLKDTAFVSLGGYATTGQIKDVLKQFPNARISTGYDNDVLGRLYDVITYAAAIGKDVKVSKDDTTFHFKWDNKHITIPQEKLTLNCFKEESGLKHRFGNVFKPNGEQKDFNEQLVRQKTELKERLEESKGKAAKI